MAVDQIEAVEGVHVYVGPERSRDYHTTVMDVEGGTVSPGGAADRLGVSRQYVHQLISEGKLETWVYYERSGKRARYIDVSCRDIAKLKKLREST